jgi:hypothetical protein
VIYLVVSIGTKPPLIHIVEALHTRVLLPGHRVSPKSIIRLATKACHEGTRQAPLVTLMSPPLRRFSTKEEGLHVPRIKRPRRSTPSWRVKNLPGNHLDTKALTHLVHLDPLEESLHKVGTPCIQLGSKLMLALHTL